ncbi:hypothetical protein TWF694_006064 [Orbilia ellipsospora]|uniref:Uncharacterized protein n=1 Tax=Orbilia ellipsospora TaxID=2528407 RepID=A0AAV9WR54_9PEZI
MYHLHTTIEIAAPPSTVRAKFLDFSQIPKYHPNGFFKSIAPLVPGQPLEPGLKMHNELDGMTIEPVLIENSPSVFRWGGSGLLGTFKGEHIFRFEPSSQTQGGTTFTHEEKFTGLLSFIMGSNVAANSIGLRASTQKGFEKYNVDLKKWCEGSA